LYFYFFSSFIISNKNHAQHILTIQIDVLNIMKSEVNNTYSMLFWSPSEVQKWKLQHQSNNKFWNNHSKFNLSCQFGNVS